MSDGLKWRIAMRLANGRVVLCGDAIEYDSETEAWRAVMWRNAVAPSNKYIAVRLEPL